MSSQYEKRRSLFAKVLDGIVLVSFVVLGVVLVDRILNSPFSEPDLAPTNPEGVKEDTSDIQEPSRREPKTGASEFAKRQRAIQEIKEGLEDYEYDLELRSGGSVLVFRTNEGDVQVRSSEVNVGPCEPPLSENETTLGQSADKDQSIQNSLCLFVFGGKLRLNEEVKAQLPKHLFFRF